MYNRHHRGQGRMEQTVIFDQHLCLTRWVTAHTAQKNLNLIRNHQRRWCLYDRGTGKTNVRNQQCLRTILWPRLVRHVVYLVFSVVRKRNRQHQIRKYP